MAFQPQEPELKQLAGFLKDSLSGYDRERQKNAEQVSCGPRGFSEMLRSPFWYGKRANNTNRCLEMPGRLQTTLTISHTYSRPPNYLNLV
jgi:hypothetical protein